MYLCPLPSFSKTPLLTSTGRYGIVLDAGSSGTRLYIYRWLDGPHAREIANTEQLQSLPVIKTKKKWTKKTRPGISTFGEEPSRVGPDHLEGLLDKAQKVVPKEEIQRTPLFLLATAGVRLLPEHQRIDLLKEVCSYARSKTHFLLPDCDVHIRVIPGDTEGLYGWIAANYLLGGFDAPQYHGGPKDHSTFGFLDMGGASAQIAFAPNVTEAERHANDLKMLRLRRIDGTPAEYKVFTTTWLGFGVTEARRRYVEALQEAGESQTTKTLLDPCLPAGLTATPTGDVFLPDSKTVDGKTPILKGTGKFDECLERTFPLLEKDHICEDDPCLLGGVHVPAIDFDVNHFVGVSEYWHTTHEIFQTSEEDKPYDFNTYQERVSSFCGLDWKRIEQGIERHEWGGHVDEKRAVEVCFKASWLINILHEGIGIPRVGLETLPNTAHNGTSKALDGGNHKGYTASFQAIDTIDGVEVSWTLGKMVLYVSSQIPPLQNDALPVGFGSNTPGIPADFEYPSTQHLQPTSTANATLPPSHPQSDGETWRTSYILQTATTRRIPGILLFLLILCLAVYLLLSRSRRHRLYSSLPSRNHNSPSRSSRHAFFAGKLPSIFRPLPNLGEYERVNLEDGNLHGPENFELGGMEDESWESSNGIQGGRTSGWATPRLGSSHGLGGPGLGTFEGLGSGPGLGIGLGSNPIERSGLIGRSESREKIVGMAEGRKERKASPASASTLKLGKIFED
ncbi:MAG: hypothetical protein Q9163_001923 [Psora crenata]